MRSKRWKEKEFSTETLTQVEVDEIMAGSADYAKGKAPVSRNTQYAEDLDDLAGLQKASHERDEMKQTHNYGVLEAVRDYNPEDDNPDYRGYPDQSSREPEEIWEPESGFYDDEEAEFYNELEGGQPYGDDQEFALQPLTPEDENYGDIMENYDDIMEKMSSDPIKPKYWFKEQGDHWFCTCGQLNKGDICTNCGLERDLLRSLFFLHEPGDEPGKYEGMTVPYTEVEMSKGLSTKAKLLIAIAIIAILLAGTGLFSYYYIIKPSMEKEAAQNAATVAESMKSNVVMFTADTDDFLRDSYISSGDSCCKTEDFEDAIKFYGMAQNLKDSDGIKDKINNAKYGYVCAHKDEGGDKFEKYLNELYKANYSDIGSIYDEYYAWHFKIVANLDAEDYSSDISTASRSDIIYFHVSVSGGPPKETLDVYYKAKYPSGNEQIEQIGSGWKSGSKGSARCMYAVPLLGKEGKLTFTVYDKSTNEVLGEDSITLSK